VRQQITIELSVDYSSEAKNDAVRRACQRAARYAYFTALMLKDGARPQIAISLDDIVLGHRPLALYDDPTDLELDYILAEDEKR
jgi:hypothetical protein